MPALTLFVAAWCPVDGEESVVCLKANGAGAIFYFCPFCGVAWPTPPPQNELNSVAALHELAPQGAQFPLEQDVARLVTVKRVVGNDFLSSSVERAIAQLGVKQ